MEAKMFAASDAYDRFMGRWSRLLAPLLVEFSGVRDGDRVLDVGTGTGSLACAVAARRPKAAVTGIDPSEAFIAHARGNVESERVRFAVGEARNLRFPDASFDAVLSMLVMNFIPDHEKALAEMRRVARPRGRVTACVWDYDAGMRSLRIFWDEVVALDPRTAAKDERHMKLSRQGQLGALWRAAGLLEVEETPLVIEQRFQSFDDYWSPFLEGVGPAGACVVSLPQDSRAELAGRLKRRLVADRPDGPFALQARAWAVTGIRPPA
jgi:SAM-dependent methyltransferase